MEYSSIAIANYLLDLAWAEGKSIDPIKTQKLVFIAQGWSLAVYDNRLVGEDVEAWDFGPVFPELYREFKRYGRSPIARPGACFDDFDSDSDQEGRHILDNVWRVHKSVSGIQLANRTHDPGTPWEVVTREHRKSGKVWAQHLIIPDSLIRDYYREDLRRKSGGS